MLIWYISSSRPGISHLSKEPWFSFGGAVWVLRVVWPPSSSLYTPFWWIYQGNMYVEYLKNNLKTKVFKVKMSYEFMLMIVLGFYLTSSVLYMYISFFPHYHSQFSKSLEMIVIMLCSILVALYHSIQNSNTNVTTNNIITENSWTFFVVFCLVVILLLGYV